MITRERSARLMISLRKHIDSFRDVPTPVSDPSLEALRSALAAMGDCGQRAVPSLGAGIGQKLAEVREALKGPATPDALKRATNEVNSHLSRWAESALEHHNANERELREIIGVVAQATETISRKDERYSREIGDVTGSMRSIAEMKDLAVVRRSILESATRLQSCVEKMAEEGRTALGSLTAEVAQYRTRLEEAERVAALDPLTQLANRGAFERRLAGKIAVREKFSLILIDLNDFKAVNDNHGHVAGDELLRKFAEGLRTQFRAADMVSRWGGDEFAVVVAGDLKEAGKRADAVKEWVLGEYKLSVGGQTVKVVAAASIGVVEWNGTETGSQLLERADKGLYAGKAVSRTAARPRPH
jgi:diguanylate cyclase (GGDEF)-like protein